MLCALGGGVRGERFGADREAQAQRALDGDAAIAEVGAVEDFAGAGAGTVGRKRIMLAGDVGDGVLVQKLALAAERFAHWRMHGGGVNQLHFAFAIPGFVVGQHPHVGADAGVVEQVVRQRDDGLKPVVFHDPAADF